MGLAASREILVDCPQHLVRPEARDHARRAVDPAHGRARLDAAGCVLDPKRDAIKIIKNDDSMR